MILSKRRSGGNTTNTGNLWPSSDETFNDQNKFQIQEQVDEDMVKKKRVDIDEENSPSTNYISLLPLEILDEIFRSYLSRRDRKNVRLVCHLWYDRGNIDENLVIGPTDDLVHSFNRTFEHHQNLENCGFKCFSICFRMTNVSQIPVVVWEKIGARIRYLDFHCCRLGNKVIENVVLHCKGLRFLRVNLASLNVEDSFCSLETLRNLNVIQEKLFSLEFYHSQHCLSRSQFVDFDYEMWKRIFFSLRRIFPNVQSYGSGTFFSKEQLRKGNITFRIGLPHPLPSTGIEEYYRITALACALSSNDAEDWRNALKASYSFSLHNIYLVLVKDTLEKKDVDALLKFFTRHKELMMIRFGLKKSQFRGFDDYWNVSEIVLSIVFHILDVCSELCELHLVDLDDWFCYLEETQYSQLASKTLKLAKFSVSDLHIEGSTMQSREDFDPVAVSSWLPSLMPNYPHIEHLILRPPISKATLLAIFEHMINLKTLDVNIHSYHIVDMLKYECTPRPTSINRLQSLERLKIHILREEEEVMLVDNSDWYDEFEFPKLRYLYCFLPKKAPVLDYIGTKMPSLREADFSQTTCKSASFHLECTPDIFQSTDMTRIFARCPKLQSIRYCRGTYFYEPFAAKVIFKENPITVPPQPKVSRLERRLSVDRPRCRGYLVDTMNLAESL